MTWRNAKIAPDCSHHTFEDEPLYPYRFDAVLPFHSPGLAPVKENNEAWHISTSGEPAYSNRFHQTFGYYCGAAAVEDKTGWYHIGPDGQALYEERYAWCGNFQDDFCAVRSKVGEYFHIGLSGAPLYQRRWRYAGDYRKGIAVVQNEKGLSTHLDSSGNHLHDQWFHDLDVYHKGFARAQCADGWCHIDTSGSPLYADRYSMVEPFYNGQARVEKPNGALVVIDETGKQIHELRSPITTTEVSTEFISTTDKNKVAPGELQVGPWHLIPSMVRNLDNAPIEYPIALLVRHSVREALAPGSAGYMTPITEDGCKLAAVLGKYLGSRVRSIHSSPVPRCVQTADHILRGANINLPIHHDRFLGDPGVFVLDNKETGRQFRTLGTEEALQYMVTHDEPLPGMMRPDQGARYMVSHILSKATTPGIHIFVTHDNLVNMTAAHLLKRDFGNEHWPLFLEGALFFNQDESIITQYRDYRSETPRPLGALSEDDIREFARLFISKTIGLPVEARFFVAGGCFKSLITGEDPKDIDIWAPTPGDRAKVREQLESKGELIESSRYNERWLVNGWTVDLGQKTTDETLEQRLNRFDIGLSGIGYEHIPHHPGNVHVHPLAKISQEKKQVLLIKPLINWKYALASLDRMRRYAQELGYQIPPEEEQLIWGIFDQQPSEMKYAMLGRYDRVAKGGHGVREEAICRFE